MSKIKTACAIAALTVPFALSAPAAQAAPASAGLSLSDHFAKRFASDVTQVQYRRRARRGINPGVGIAIGAGALIAGAAIAASRPRVYYAPAPSYYYYPSAPYDPAIDYCIRRFKSYDLASGTYLGYDGYRHPCP